MFAELAAITSAISAINNTIATFKEGKANAQQAASLLGKFSTTAQKLDDWEKKKKLIDNKSFYVFLKQFIINYYIFSYYLLLPLLQIF